MCDKIECNHNPNDDKTTLKKIPRKEMVYPPQDKYYCDVCHDFFIFTKKK